LVFVAACCVLAIPTIAEAKSEPTEAAVTGTDGVTIALQLDSEARNCLRKRTVLFAVEGAATAFRTSSTDRGGTFSLALADVPADASSVLVTAARKGRCEADTIEIAFDQATLTGGPDDGAFRGVLSSSVEACEPGRRIELYEISSEPVFVGWNLTEANGAWTIAQADGSYEARATPGVVGDGDSFSFCSAVVSFPWTYEEPFEP
jgi:hypothetical protein